MRGTRLGGWTGLLLLVSIVLPTAASADGEFDPSFGVGGRTAFNLSTGPGAESANTLLPLGDGRFLTVGPGEGKGIWVTQHLANGSLDRSFGTAGSSYISLSDFIFSSQAVREPNGSIVTAGGISNVSFDTMITRLTPNGGALDQTFGNDAPNPPGDGISIFDMGEDDIARGVVIDSTGRIVFAGRRGAPGARDVLLARLNSDGSIDKTFGGPTGVTTNLGGDEFATDIAMQGDRLIVLVSSGGTALDVLRYRPDGTLDPSFGGGDGIVPLSLPGTTEANVLLVQPDGRIVVASSPSGRPWIVRLQADGSPEPSFGAGGATQFDTAGAKISVFGIAQSDDGKTLAVGYSNAPERNTRAVVLRALAGGTPDPAWGTNGVLTIPAPTETSEYGFGVAVQPDRKVLVGGETYDGNDAEMMLVRLLGDSSPPDTAITAAPKKKSRSPLRHASLSFQAVGDVHTTFECRLTRPQKPKKHRHHHRRRRHPHRAGAGTATVTPPPFAACTSPIAYAGLRRPGRYVFEVRATDPAGNVDPTPASAAFRVLPKHRHRHHHKKR